MTTITNQSIIFIDLTDYCLNWAQTSLSSVVKFAGVFSSGSKVKDLQHLRGVVFRDLHGCREVAVWSEHMKLTSAAAGPLIHRSAPLRSGLIDPSDRSHAWWWDGLFLASPPRDSNSTNCCWEKKKTWRDPPAVRSLSSKKLRIQSIQMSYSITDHN